MAPFKPVGEIAQWRMVYDEFRKTEVGETISYEDLATLLGVDAEVDRPRVQAAARLAARHLLELDDRAVETVPRVGYRIAPAVRQIPMAGHQVDRAGRALDKGKQLTTHVRLDELSEPERQIVHGMALMFAQVGEWARQINRRVDSHEDRLADVEAELRELRAKRKS